jgi:cell division protein FtsN
VAEERSPADVDARVYYLQLGAFGSEANANALARKVREAGFDVLITGGNGQYRVRVGPVRGQDAARALQNRLRERGFTPVILSG